MYLQTVMQMVVPTKSLDMVILTCISRIKTQSGDLESSHCALSIGGSFKAKHQSFVNRLNSRGV